MELTVDKNRIHSYRTGIIIRAKYNDRWDSFDIGDLTKESLLEWLKSRGGDNPLAENCIGIILEYGHLHEHKLGKEGDRGESIKQ